MPCVHADIGGEGRRQREGGDERRHRDVAKHRPAPCRDDEPQHPQRDERREEIQAIEVGERLQQPRGAVHAEPPSAARIEIRVEREQRQRRPERRQHLQVRHLRRTIGCERECKPGQKRGGATARQPADEQQHGEAAQRIREQRDQVGRRNRIAQHPGDRRRHRAQSEQMLRKGERVRRGMKNRELPPGVRQRHYPGVPVQQRGREQRVAGVVHERR